MSRAAATPPTPHLDAIVLDLVERRLQFHQIPKSLSAEEAAEVRRRALEVMTNASLSNMRHYSFDVDSVSSRNCENLIGVAQVPIGIVGPVPVRGNEVNEEVFVPLATTEGALIASTNRGCAALRAAGGAKVFVEDVGMTRAPVFRTSGIEESQRLVTWLTKNEEEIRTIAEGTSRFLELISIRPFVFSTTVFVRFRFRSGDAMGMNMATIACDRIVTDLIEPATGISCTALSGNYCVDKKPAAVNFQEGRGKRLFAEVEIPGEVLSKILKTNPDDLVEVQYRKNLLGSIAAGSSGFNAHFANVLAGFFIATGQDLAHVVDGSTGVTFVEKRPNGAAYFSVFLPTVPLGAIGGGTGLATQAESLAMLGVKVNPDRPGSAVMRLAEILAATVLAGELSLMAAFTSRDLASAHERLGRGPAEPVDPLSEV
ncbi:MAG: hydroxymethylglutaryl-CoA reductase [Thermoanaerobaculia bacterium]|nr:hydroxymethylglutaryl-CoA reductase [Thermoanaerobaculia bacterium]